MADFRRPPEWQQPADRHTELTDPVLTVRQLSRWESLTRRSTPRIDSALVFVTAAGGSATYLPPRRPSRSQIAAQRYTAVYEVDMGVHPVRVELALPSDNDAFEFTATVEVSWQVEEPALFVASGERDVPALITGHLQQLIRPVGRRFPVEQSPAAERAALQAVAQAGQFAAAIGLRVTCAVRVRLDDAAIAHHRELRAIRYADQKLDPEHALRMREDRLNADRALEQGRQQHELAMQQQNLSHEHALLAGRQEIELQGIEAEKITFYRYHLEQNGVAAWAFHLARHPEDSRLVMEHLREDELQLVRNQMELATAVLKGDALEEYQMEEPRRLALQVLKERLDQQVLGRAAPPVAHEGALPAGPPPAPAAPPAPDAP